MPSLTVDGVRIPVETGDTLLEAMQRAGMMTGLSCYAGDCGVCKCEYLSGEIVEQGDLAGALGPTERARNIVLGCRTEVVGDVVIRSIRDDERVTHPLRTVSTRVESVDALTHDIKRFRLAIDHDAPLEFSAGQYAKVTFAPDVHREYSMANPPHDPVLEFHVRRTANGLASNHVWHRLAIGDRVEVEGPQGSCYLRERHGAPILLAGGGSGMAPMLSILESALHLGMSQPIRLYFGAREERDLYAMERLEALARMYRNFRYDIALSGTLDTGVAGEAVAAGDQALRSDQPDASDQLQSSDRGRRPYRTGMLHEVIAADWNELVIGKAYLAGPPVMVEAVSTLLRSRGVALHDIHGDAYYTEAEKAKLLLHSAKVGT